MGLLKSEPQGIVESIAELMAIAKAMEDEAAARYRQLARRMQGLGNQAAKQVFGRLALEEDAHAVKVEELSKAVLGVAPDRADIRWELPKDLEDEGMSDLAVSRLVTPYRALSIAVHNEERAFAFWSYVSAYAPSAQIREYAEKMAREELRHASILRRERRRAYRSQLGRAPPSPEQGPAASPVEKLKKTAVSLETSILEKCKMTAACLRGDSPTAHLLAKITDESAANMQALGFAGGENPAKDTPEPLTSVEILDEAIAAAEAAAEGYLALADSAIDEGVVSAGQKLSRSAIARLVALRQRRAELAPLEFDDEPPASNGVAG